MTTHQSTSELASNDTIASAGDTVTVADIVSVATEEDGAYASAQQLSEWRYIYVGKSTGYILLVLLDPDQLLAEVLDDVGEEPAAVEGVALSNIQQQ